MLKLTFLAVFIFSLFTGLNNESINAADDSLRTFSDVELNKLHHVTDFKLLTPENSFVSYKIEVKEPYPLVLSESISKVRLHYFDKSGDKYLFGIEEHKAVGYKFKRVETIIDARKQTSTTKTSIEDFKFNENGEKINLNGIEARYEPWVNHTPGGYLRWVQDGTYIEIESGDISKEMMVELAKSMK